MLLKVPGAENRKAGCGTFRGQNGVPSSKSGIFSLGSEKASNSAHFHVPTSKIGLGAISGGPAAESMPVPNWAGRWNSDLGGTLLRVVSQRATRGSRMEFFVAKAKFRLFRGRRKKNYANRPRT